MKKLILFLSILIPNVILSQSDVEYIKAYVEKPGLLYTSTFISFSDSCTEESDWLYDAPTIGGCEDCITTTIGNNSYYFNCFPKSTQDRIIPLNINISPDTGLFIIGVDLDFGDLIYVLLDSQNPGYHQMPYICQGPVSNDRFSILFEYPLTVNVIGGCELGYVIIDNDETSVSYELTDYYDPTISYILPPTTDTIFNLSNGDYLLTLNDSIIEQIQFSVSNTIFNDELIVPYVLLPIQDPYIVPYLIVASPYDEISWNFGDGTPILYNDVNPVHGYTQEGIYTLELTIVRNGCSKTLQQMITIYNPLGIQQIYPIIPSSKQNKYYYGIDGRLIRVD
jgi:hypothetical protein